MHLETVGKVRPLSFLIRPSYHMQQQHVTKSWPFHSMSSPRWVSSDSNRSKRKMAFRGFESASSALPALVKLVSLTWLNSIQLSLSRLKKLINSITAILVRYLTKRFIGDYCSGKGKFKLLIVNEVKILLNIIRCRSFVQEDGGNWWFFGGFGDSWYFQQLRKLIVIIWKRRMLKKILPVG